MEDGITFQIQMYYYTLHDNSETLNMATSTWFTPVIQLNNHTNILSGFPSKRLQ